MFPTLTKCALVGALITTGQAHAATLRVTPTVIDIPIPAAASSLRLQNAGESETTMQVRIFRWSQESGTEKLTETNSVVVSPPIARIPAGKTQLVRIVRVSKEAIRAEESYRIFVDEIPQKMAGRNNAVNLTVRHSIPAFFTGPVSTVQNLEWAIEKRNGLLTCVVHNYGDKRVRISALQVTNSRGQTLANQKGLLGYVLAKSSMRWPISLATGKVSIGERVEIFAQTENGPISAQGTVSARHETPAHN